MAQVVRCMRVRHPSSMFRVAVRLVRTSPRDTGVATQQDEVDHHIQEVEGHVRQIRKHAQTRPAPQRLGDFSETPQYLPENEKELGVLTDQPNEHRARTVRILLREGSVVQSADPPVMWSIRWPETPRWTRWTNPYLGWTSTNDPLSCHVIYFDTREEAMRFARRQGWDWEYVRPADNEKEIGNRKYASNFLPPPVEAKLMKEGADCKHFEYDKPSASHHFSLLTYHGEGEAQPVP